MTESAVELNILHLSTQLGWRGGEQQIAYLMEELREMQVPQMIFCPDGSQMAGFCHKFGFMHESFKPAGSFSPRLSGLVARLAKKNEASLIHAHDSHALNHALLAHTLFHQRLPIVVNRRVDFPIKSRIKYNHAAVRRIICDSEAIRKVMATCLGRDDKLLTIHSGIDVERFSNMQSQGLLRRDYRIGADESIIANVAAIVDHKDYFTFVDTAEKLIGYSKRLRFLIIGDGPKRDKIEKYIEKKGLSDYFILTGFRPDIPQILPELDCFLITSKTEGLGTVIIEAFAARVPVVATQAGGIPELVHHELTGLLAGVGDSLALSKAVIRVLEDEKLRQNLIINAAKVPARFDKKVIANKTAEVYQSVMG